MKFQFLGLCMYLCAHNHETLELLVNFRLETLALVLCSILSEECSTNAIRSGLSLFHNKRYLHREIR